MAVVDRKRIPPMWIEWDIIDVLIGGRSAIDIPRLYTDTLERADAFIASYGYDMSDIREAREVASILDEARRFVVEVLGPDPENRRPPLKMPAEIAEITDVRRLMLLSTVRTGEVQQWACAILRLMHTITHVNNDFSVIFFPQIQEQIVHRIQSIIFEDANGELFLGDKHSGIPLYQLEVKSRKPFDSTVLKLLHKVENVTAAIFDRVGVRFVAQTRLDALLTLKYLVDHNVVSFPNVNPTRSRNSLANALYIRREMDKLLPLYNRGEIGREELRHLAHLIVESEDAKPKVRYEELRERNSFSSTAYTSMQFTVRQLIKVTLPEVRDPETGRMVKPTDPLRFFFPYEVQILDRQSYIESRRGRASHEDYKRQQLIAARKRIFRDLVE